MIISPSELGARLQRWEDPAWEPCFDEYAEHMLKLNEIAMAAGEHIEGSLFFQESALEVLSPRPHEIWRSKRRNFALFCSFGNHLLEVGFNAGHSCLLALTVNASLSYTGIDIAEHGYTRACFDYLKCVFGPRINLIIGDSRNILQEIRGSGENFDLFHIDGGHDFLTFQTDMANVLEMARHRPLILIDDTWLFRVNSFCDYLLLEGKIAELELPCLWSETPDHRLFTSV